MAGNGAREREREREREIEWETWASSGKERELHGSVFIEGGRGEEETAGEWREAAGRFQGTIDGVGFMDECNGEEKWKQWSSINAEEERSWAARSDRLGSAWGSAMLSHPGFRGTKTRART
jgi:hypothetical protein